MHPSNIEVDTSSFPQDFRALVVGAAGGIGQAFVEHLKNSRRCAYVLAASRATGLDFDDESSIGRWLDSLQDQTAFHLIIVCTGVLHGADFSPEKKLGDLSYAKMNAVFRINTFGPALLLGPLARKLDRERGVFAVLSAKVGSIEDNRLGGWYSYRASKAALNMMIKTASIEIKRTQPSAVLVAMHPGTVDTPLSQPFGGAQSGQPPLSAAAQMLNVLNSMTAEDTGSFKTYSGEPLPW
jgi:NAD(P)-dependent dehydrogenase (short-subunit alcohol dehydrogenase family)